jgi:peptidyl-dipeptidase A
VKSSKLALFALVSCACPPEKPPVVLTQKVETPPPPIDAAPPQPSAEDQLVAQAKQFVLDSDPVLRKLTVNASVAEWNNQTDITPEHEELAAKANEVQSNGITELIKDARKFAPVVDKLDASSARQLQLLRFFFAAQDGQLAPDDPKLSTELAQVAEEMTSIYGKGVCADKDGKHTCKIVDDYGKVLATSHNPAELTAAWKTWHDNIGHAERDKFARYVELANLGARAIGFDSVADEWRGQYDMPPDAFQADVDRLWNQVKPLYTQLHCYARRQLNKRYGDKVVPKTGPIPTEVPGNMWAQEWDHIYPDLEPFHGVAPIDVTPALAKKYPAKPDALAGAQGMMKIGEAFYTSLGMDPLPDTFWQRSMLVRPEPPRQAVCHASSWDVTYSNDLRIKMCIEPTQDDLFVLHHELGHSYYFHAYYTLPILFQQGANDGFHEAIGDTIQLSMTPDYLHQKGLLDKVTVNEHATLNAQMKVALSKIAFLPFAVMVDKWRWDVFAGKVKPDQYNQHWWDLKREYQGVMPPMPRAADDFDAGAKYHVAANTPYMRYFLAAVLQFQFHRALCRVAGFTGPLHECSIYGNKAAGEAYMKMLRLGASKPWQDALAEMTGERDMDASAILEYFAPLQKWLEEQNQGQQCGW